MRRPMVSGRSVSRLKYLMSCCLPSSKMLKSPFSRFPIRPPFLSRTLKRMLTTSTSTLMVGASWANAGAGARSSAGVSNAANARSTGAVRIIWVDARFGILVAMRKAILHLKKADPLLGSVIDRVGAYRMEYRDPGFETLVRSIVYQQLSGKVAKVIFGR